MLLVLFFFFTTYPVVVKGSSSTLYGSDAIAGIINVISKQPKEQKELTFLVNQTSLLGTDVNGYYSQRWKKIGITLLSANSFQAAKDVNKDGFSDLPKTKTFTINPSLYFYFNTTTTLKFGITGTFDNRKGGDMMVIKDNTDADHQFYEENISNRISSQLKFDKVIDKNRQFTFKNSVSYFKRSLNESQSMFQGKQVASYSEAMDGWV